MLLVALGEAAQGEESAVCGGAYGSGVFAEDVGGVGCVEVHDDAEQDRFGLVGREGGDEGDRVGGGEAGEGGFFGVVGCG